MVYRDEGDCSPATESYLHLTEARARQHRSRNGGDASGAFRAIFTSYKMNVSVLEAGFLWRVRVLQGPAERHETFTSVLSVVQVRMANPGCLADGCPNVHPTNLDC